MAVSRRAWIMEALRAVSLGAAALVGILGIRSFLSQPFFRRSPSGIPNQPTVTVNRPDGRPVRISLRCPHLGCMVKPAEIGFVCPCHGSQFDELGHRIAGPAQSDLELLADLP